MIYLIQKYKFTKTMTFVFLCTTCMLRHYVIRRKRRIIRRRRKVSIHSHTRQKWIRGTSAHHFLRGWALRSSRDAFEDFFGP